MRRLPLHAAPVIAAIACAPASADTVTLKNGDRITGTLLNLSRDTLVMKTAYAGEVKIGRSAIASLDTEGEVTLVLDGDIRRARLGSAAPGNVAVQPSGQAAQTLPLESIALVNPTPAQGGPGRAYRGRVNLGASRTDGNSDVQRVYGDGELVARSRFDRWTVRGDVRDAKDNGRRTESKWRAHGAYDRFYDRRMYSYVRTSFEHDEFADVDLRTTLGAGLGLQVLEGEPTSLSVQGGLDYVRIDRSIAADEDYPALGWEVKFEHKMWDGRLALFHGHDGFLGLEDAEQVLLRTRTGLRLPLAQGFNATAQLNLDWDREPAPGRRSTDRTWLLTLGYAW